MKGKNKLEKSSLIPNLNYDLTQEELDDFLNDCDRGKEE